MAEVEGTSTGFNRDRRDAADRRQSEHGNKDVRGGDSKDNRDM